MYPRFRRRDEVLILNILVLGELVDMIGGDQHSILCFLPIFDIQSTLRLIMPEEFVIRLTFGEDVK